MRKNRLTKCSMEYLAVLFVIWQLVDYYAKMFHVDAGDDPARIIARVMEKNGITYVRLSFPKIEHEPYKQLVQRMKRVYNEYLRYVLLPEQDILLPFSTGSSVYNIMEALYVETVYEDKTHINLDVIYVDNLEAYDLVRRDELEIFKEDLQ